MNIGVRAKMLAPAACLANCPDAQTRQKVFPNAGLGRVIQAQVFAVS